MRNVPIISYRTGSARRHHTLSMNGFRGLTTAGLGLAAVLAAVMIFVEETESAAMFDQDSAHFKAQQKSCSALCGYCPSCNGFYCGEECICECQQAAEEHVQCINKIKENSDKLGLIYDVLIQLPRSATTHHDHEEAIDDGSLPTRFARSASPGSDKHLSADEAATFRKVLELAQLPVWLTKVPLQARINFGGVGKTAPRSKYRQRQQQNRAASRRN